VKSGNGGILDRILAKFPFETDRERALMQELDRIKKLLGEANTCADERLGMITTVTALADERVALLAAASERADAATARASTVEAQLEAERRQRDHERDREARHTLRLELRVQALDRRRRRLQAELRKLQDQSAGPDESGRIRELQEEKEKLQQRLADLQTYFIMRVEPLNGVSFAEERQGSATSC